MYHRQAHSLSLVDVARLLARVSEMDIAPGPGGSRGSEPMQTAAVYRDVLDEGPLGRHWSHAMLMALYPSSQLVAHVDPPIQGTRYHLPLSVNPGCWVFHTGTWQQLEVGGVYTMDPTQLHGAVNWGDTVRIHLVLDIP